MTAPEPPGAEATRPRIPLYSDEFTADPHRVYREMRRLFGPFVPVELAPGVPATLVIGYRAGLEILNDSDRFSADPRDWQRTVPDDCPALPMLGWRPIPMRNTGAAHTRLRSVVGATLAEVDLHAVHRVVERTATPLINSFCSSGTADLVSDYALPLVFAVVMELLGCPPALGAQAAAHLATIADGGDMHQAIIGLESSMLELIQMKRTTPRSDIGTGLLRHGAALDDDELLQQLVMFYGVGMEPVQALITNTLRLLIIDKPFGDDITSGALSTRDALDQVLFADPPLPNNCIRYPVRPILIDSVWLPAHQPVVVSMAACNNDPDAGGGRHIGNRAHLAWGAGVHACPARPLSYLIAQSSVDHLLEALPDIRLRVPDNELRWQPGLLQRALAELPVTFEPSPPLPTP
ncbi:putative cytochrome P450 [Nocardia nova SH22a]|uniref:Putative cytochrome P450 n=1 Tax=Nocardia nova SH22a TaxID=1415166 RepID=W5THE9_9NOCA|nr:cytochrome P450 [Nocardia nova]AHH18393.1 putative cytochrome P450 [Nocardia nova SH22a]